jgi:oligosaccharyltransferase complex subunit alpha (ribophorin I)
LLIFYLIDFALGLKTTVVQIPGNTEALAYKIELATELGKGKTIELDVELVFTEYLVQFPAEITQKEKQLVKFTGNHYIYSPYKVNKQTTKVTLSSRNIENFSKLKPFSQSENIISFGPYENTIPFSQSELIVHYENNSPFLTITKLERLIEISHWGNIAVEEKIEIVHTGAKLKVCKNQYLGLLWIFDL